MIFLIFFKKIIKKLIQINELKKLYGSSIYMNHTDRQSVKKIKDILILSLYCWVFQQKCWASKAIALIQTYGHSLSFSVSPQNFIEIFLY